MIHYKSRWWNSGRISLRESSRHYISYYNYITCLVETFHDCCVIGSVAKLRLIRHGGELVPMILELHKRQQEWGAEGSFGMGMNSKFLYMYSSIDIFILICMAGL